MTKEQFLLFKQDLKTAIEAEKIYSKFYRIERKEYYNAGFSSQEEQDKTTTELWNKAKEIQKLVTTKEIEIKDLIGRPKIIQFRINADYFYVHWAYYCAKHRLNEDERKAYYTIEFNKMSETKRFTDYYLNDRIDQAERVIKFYENM